MCQKKNMAFNVELLLRWCKLIENRMMPCESPLRQFCRESFSGYNAFKMRRENREGFLSSNVVQLLEEKDIHI